MTLRVFHRRLRFDARFVRIGQARLSEGSEYDEGYRNMVFAGNGVRDYNKQAERGTGLWCPNRAVWGRFSP